MSDKKVMKTSVKYGSFVIYLYCACCIIYSQTLIKLNVNKKDTALSEEPSDGHDSFDHYWCKAISQSKNAVCAF